MAKYDWSISDYFKYVKKRGDEALKYAAQFEKPSECATDAYRAKLLDLADGIESNLLMMLMELAELAVKFRTIRSERLESLTPKT